MAGRTKKILTAAGIAAATTGLAVVVKKKAGGKAAAVYRVAPTDDGWEVRGEGAERAASRHGTKKEAVAAGRDLARSKAPSRLVIHGTDGKVQRSHDYDPGD